METEAGLRVTLWGLGLCVTGFLFLLGWIWKVNSDVNNNKVMLEKRVTYDWVENRIIGRLDKMDKENSRLYSHFISEFGDGHTEGNTRRALKETNAEISKLNKCLIGDVKEPGLISDVREIKHYIEKLNKNGRTT